MTMSAQAHSLPAFTDDSHGLSPAAEKTVSWGTSALLHAGGALLMFALCYAVARPPVSDPRGVPMPPQIGDTSELTAFDHPTFLGRFNDPTTPPMQKITREVPEKPGSDAYGKLDGMLNELTGKRGDAADAIIAIGGGRGVKSGIDSDLDGIGIGRRCPFGPANSGGTPTIYKMPSFGARKIVFVLDHSGSMLDTFDFLRQEVHRVVGSFTPLQQFGVVMFSETVTVLGPEQLQRGVTENKAAMLASLDQIRAAGENDDQLLPFQLAIGKALTMQPELIVFLTDGEFDRRLPAVVKEMNKGPKKVMINTIAFVKITRESEMGLQQIAHENGGRYKFVSAEDLNAK